MKRFIVSEKRISVKPSAMKRHFVFTTPRLSITASRYVEWDDVPQVVKDTALKMVKSPKAQGRTTKQGGVTYTIEVKAASKKTLPAR